MGRKSKYFTHVEPYLEDIIKLRREGYREIDICKKLNVGHSSFAEYKRMYPDLMEALKGSTLELVDNIKASVYQTAMGGFVKTKSKYKYHQGKKILISSEEEIMAPNTTAQAMALKILSPELREILNNNLQVNNTVTNNAMDNFSSFSEEINKYENIEDDEDG